MGNNEMGETMKMGGWIAVDLDGTLAHYDGWKGSDVIGEPIPKMVKRVKDWLADGKDVRIFTARICEGPAAKKAIQEWVKKNIGRDLLITNVKDTNMIELWDDRCITVEKNTGEVLTNGIKS